MTVGPNIAQIFADMTNDSDSFKPLKLCEVLKECGKNQSPLVTALETDDNVFNESLPEAETETTVFSIHLITPLPQS
ncbi:unnamed protein product [Toxocara canis]|uniref:VHS domain-containing protein n=1 Tax=Toxocara canis TaxID=6265 RepID=A0A183UZ32_TOXCA|nr:unnamed protein product [Toxocara canis]